MAKYSLELVPPAGDSPARSVVIHRHPHKPGMRARVNYREKVAGNLAILGLEPMEAKVVRAGLIRESCTRVSHLDRRDFRERSVPFHEDYHLKVDEVAEGSLVSPLKFFRAGAVYVAKNGLIDNPPEFLAGGILTSYASNLHTVRSELEQRVVNDEHVSLHAVEGHFAEMALVARRMRLELLEELLPQILGNPPFDVNSLQASYESRPPRH